MSDAVSRTLTTKVNYALEPIGIYFTSLTFLSFCCLLPQVFIAVLLCANNSLLGQNSSALNPRPHIPGFHYWGSYLRIILRDPGILIPFQHSCFPGDYNSIIL